MGPYSPHWRQWGQIMKKAGPSFGKRIASSGNPKNETKEREENTKGVEQEEAPFQGAVSRIYKHPGKLTPIYT